MSKKRRSAGRPQRERSVDAKGPISKGQPAPRKPTVLTPTELRRPSITSEWYEEPDLCFADGHLHADPKVGIPLYGPWSSGTVRHKAEIHFGFIGTGEGIDRAAQFYSQCAAGVAGDDNHLPFPGCSADRGYRCDLRIEDAPQEKLSRQDLIRMSGIKRKKDRFRELTTLFAQKLQLLSQRDHPVDYVVVAIPNDLYKSLRVVDYTERGVGPVHLDLRRILKAEAMKRRIATQILLETTTRLVPQAGRDLDHESVVAWNLFNGMYFKVDGLPWGPVGLPPASCYIGVSFFRPRDAEVGTLRASVVQAFDENGEGLVLRGHKFQWDEESQGRSPHLTEELAAKLVSMVLDRYRQERKQLPQRVVVHKSSRFEPAERAGFESALVSVANYDLVALQPVSDVRLVRAGRYPPLRGTAFTIGDISYIYTTGYIPGIGFPHGHVPSPVQIADHVGDTPLSEIMREIMVLTKMNWNSANHSGLMPITLRFSRLVGDILREIPEGQEPEPKYRYYM